MPLCGEPVLGPEPLDLNQRRLTQALNRMLQRRKRDWLRVRRVHHSNRRTSTPTGMSASSMRIA